VVSGGCFSALPWCLPRHLAWTQPQRLILPGAATSSFDLTSFHLTVSRLSSATDSSLVDFIPLHRRLFSAVSSTDFGNGSTCSSLSTGPRSRQRTLRPFFSSTTGLLQISRPGSTALSLREKIPRRVLWLQLLWQQDQWFSWLRITCEKKRNDKNDETTAITHWRNEDADRIIIDH
jgi:hypothetical protein